MSQKEAKTSMYGVHGPPDAEMMVDFRWVKRSGPKHWMEASKRKIEGFLF